MQTTPDGWLTRARRLVALAERRLFFVGGAPRSGTTWLQQMLDAHPAVCCRGEGLFLNHVAVPLEKLMAERAQVIGDKNRSLFAHTGGFPMPDQAEVEHLVGTAILQAFDRFDVAPGVRAIGEKTPENVFHFPRLLALFPEARFIAIARDPRDVLSSAWHFFGRPQGQERAAFIANALPSMDAGARAMVEFAESNRAQSRLVTYEALHEHPALRMTELFALLGVDASASLIADIIARTSFATATGGRAAGVVQEGAFLRRGVVGDWRDTLAPADNRMILDRMGWMLPRFGWSAT